jgi:3-dehydroquinate synthase
MKPVKLKMLSYNIIIGTDILGLLMPFIKAKKYTSRFILIDKTVYKFYRTALRKALPQARFIIVVPGEKHKNPRTISNVWRTLFKHGADRKSVLINFGGGVICDMGGLAAALYMRGMDFIHVPTTLLSQVDASVGGKTAVDLDGAKNIIGAFAKPALVLIDVNTLKTLPPKEILSGWAEVLKHGLINDKKYFEDMSKLNIKNPLPTGKWARLIARSCRIKAHYVRIDEKENGPRKTLNFGHTIGHAVETISLKSKTPLLHGEAVVLGMLCAARLSVLEGHLKNDDFDKIKSVFKKHGFMQKLPAAIGKGNICRLILKDKKNVGKKIRWTLLNSIGASVFDRECNEVNISKAMDEIL